jgi:hypothetical protein
MLGITRFPLFLFCSWLLVYSDTLYAQQQSTTPTANSQASLTEAPYLYADEDTDIFDEPLFLYANENINIFADEDTALRQEQDKAFLSFLDPHQETVSSGFEAMVRSVDEFFANEKTAYTSSGSYLRVTVDFTFNEGGDFTSRGDLKIRARFPLTQRKLKLTIESDPDEQRSELEREQDTPVDRDDKAIFAGLATRWGDADKWHIDPSIGVKIRSPLDYYVRVRAGRSYEISKSSIIDLFQSIYWFDSTGYGADTNIDYHYMITENVIFRSSSAARYTEENEYWDLSQNFYITHKLSDKRAISYQAGVFGISEPTVFATDYLLLVRYRQNIHKDWLFFEVTPQILYQEEFDFKAEHSLLLRLEAYFSK